MNNGEITIRRSPIVLIRNLALIEVAAFVAYFVAAVIGDYNALYLHLPLLSNLISYHVLKLFGLASAQLVITIYVFLRWYYEFYTLSPRMISHEWGVLLRRSKNVPLRETMSVTLASGPIRNIFHYGSLSLYNTSFVSLVLADVSYPKKHLDRITEFLHNFQRAPRAERVNAAFLLADEEHEQLEFKSSFRFDHHTKQVNRELEKAAMKTIAAFLNSNGGRLVLGVDDARRPVGIEHDYKTLGRQSSDGFENHFTQIFNKMIGPDFRRLVRVQFISIEGREVGVVDVAPSNAPAYLTLDDTEHFYVRTGNITTPLKLSEVESYARARWPQQGTA